MQPMQSKEEYKRSCYYINKRLEKRNFRRKNEEVNLLVRLDLLHEQRLEDIQVCLNERLYVTKKDKKRLLKERRTIRMELGLIPKKKRKQQYVNRPAYIGK